jgi:hypothetical protein
MESQTFIPLKKLSPSYWKVRLLKVTAAFLALFIFSAIFPIDKWNHNYPGITGRLSITFFIYIIILYHILTKKFVSSVTINHADKTIEAEYVKGFKTFFVKREAKYFRFKYYKVGEKGFEKWALWQVPPYKVLQMRFNQDLELTISSNNVTFTKEILDTLTAELNRVSHGTIE